MWVQISENLFSNVSKNLKFDEHLNNFCLFWDMQIFQMKLISLVQVKNFKNYKSWDLQSLALYWYLLDALLMDSSVVSVNPRVNCYTEPDFAIPGFVYLKLYYLIRIFLSRSNCMFSGANILPFWLKKLLPKWQNICSADPVVRA